MNDADLDKLDDETIASLKAKVVELLEAQAANDSKTISSLKDKVAELVEDAEEGWAYASAYFRDKWRWEDRVAEHLRYLKQFDIQDPFEGNESPALWARKCSTERLNAILADPEILAGDDRSLWLPETLKAVQIEKDRRLADPDSA